MSIFRSARLIHAEATAESVALLRIWIFGLWAILALNSPLPLVAQLPPDILQPMGVLRIFPGRVAGLLLTPTGLAVFKAVLVVCCLAAAAGFATRASVILAALLVIIWQTLARGIGGSSSHATIPLQFGALVLAFSPCHHALTLWPRTTTRTGASAYQLTLVTVVALICVTYLFIGSYRLAHGRIELFFSDALKEWILWWNLREPDPAATTGVAWAGRPALMLLGNAGFAALTLLEISAPASLISARFRLFFIPAMLVAHAGILLLMRIDFTAQVLCYPVFIDSRYWPLRR